MLTDEIQLNQTEPSLIFYKIIRETIHNGKVTEEIPANWNNVGKDMIRLIINAAGGLSPLEKYVIVIRFWPLDNYIKKKKKYSLLFKHKLFLNQKLKIEKYSNLPNYFLRRSLSRMYKK